MYHASVGVGVVETVVSTVEVPEQGGPSAPSEELFRMVRDILRRELGEARTDSEVAALLGVAKSQAREWLIRAVEEGTLEKVKRTKPLRYRKVSSSDRLL
jgi:hypothetical protein